MPDQTPLGSLSDPPNVITSARLVVTVVCLVCLAVGWFGVALVMFVLAAATDWADGYWARRWGPITKLGRVLDPMADKLLICGVFTYLAAIPGSRVAPWVAIVVLGRELLVTTLRSVVEASGGDFSAVWIGKWKFVLQVLAAAFSLLYISAWRPDGFPPSIVDIAVWAMVAITVWSGVSYTRSGFAAMRAAS